MMPADAYSEQNEDHPHKAYRLVNVDGVPLYIGCTVNLEQRLANHRSNPHLWGRTVDVVTEDYPTRSAGLAAERAAIRAECPMWNDRHNRFTEDVAKQMFEELHGFRPSRWDALRYFDLAIARHDELVRRVHHLRGEPLPEREAVAS